MTYKCIADKIRKPYGNVVAHVLLHESVTYCVMLHCSMHQRYASEILVLTEFRRIILLIRVDSVWRRTCRAHILTHCGYQVIDFGIGCFRRNCKKFLGMKFNQHWLRTPLVRLRMRALSFSCLRRETGCIVRIQVEMALHTMRRLSICTWIQFNEFSLNEILILLHSVVRTNYYNLHCLPELQLNTYIDRNN